MDIILKKRTIQCTACHKHTSSFIETYDDKKICGACAVLQNLGVVGGAFYYPCDKCKSPKIRWYCDDSSSDIDGCREHDSYQEDTFWKLVEKKIE